MDVLESNYFRNYKTHDFGEQDVRTRDDDPENYKKTIAKRNCDKYAKGQSLPGQINKKSPVVVFERASFILSQERPKEMFSVDTLNKMFNNNFLYNHGRRNTCSNLLLPGLPNDTKMGLICNDSEMLHLKNNSSYNQSIKEYTHKDKSRLNIRHFRNSKVKSSAPSSGSSLLREGNIETIVEIPEFLDKIEVWLMRKLNAEKDSNGNYKIVKNLRKQEIKNKHQPGFCYIVFLAIILMKLLDSVLTAAETVLNYAKQTSEKLLILLWKEIDLKSAFTKKNGQTIILVLLIPISVILGLCYAFFKILNYFVHFSKMPVPRILVDSVDLKFLNESQI